MRSHLGLLAAGLLGMPAAAQQTVTFSDGVTLQPVPFSQTLRLPRFDPALGVLARVDLSGEVTLQGAVGAENVTGSPVLALLSADGRAELQGVPSPLVLVLDLDEAHVLDGFDKEIDFRGPSGVTVPFGTPLPGSWTFDQPADLAPFVGVGQLDYPTQSTGSCGLDIQVPGLSDPAELLCDIQASAHVEVTYTFDEDCNGNGIPDYLDLCDQPEEGPGTDECSEDCNANGVPDECEADCDGDGIPDDCDPGSCEPADLACEEFDRFEDLTPNDTLTVITSQHNPQQEQGYLWVNAVTPANQPVAADWLVGQALVVDGLEALQYATNAVDYRAAVAAGALTDLDGDGVRDLDGAEYEKTAGEILVPRFLGSDPQRQTRGELILIGLSGGSQFTTTADFLVYNDDEDAFSANYTFFCWEKVHTLDISNVFANQWLKDFSGQNPMKGLGNLEYGWFRVDGGVASSSFFSLLDPALYAVYVEKVGGTAAADLPFEDCTQSGHLLPRLVSGDNSESNGAPSDEDCGLRHTGRHPASLLLYPEFDNRSGVATVVTVTNTSATDDVRAHFVYIGRYGN